MDIQQCELSLGRIFRLHPCKVDESIVKVRFGISELVNCLEAFVAFFDEVIDYLKVVWQMHLDVSIRDVSSH